MCAKTSLTVEDVVVLLDDPEEPVTFGSDYEDNLCEDGDYKTLKLLIVYTLYFFSRGFGGCNYISHFNRGRCHLSHLKESGSNGIDCYKSFEQHTTCF